MFLSNIGPRPSGRRHVHWSKGKAMNETKLETAVLLPSSFRFGEVSSLTSFRAASSSDPSLGPLAAFTGTFTGNGFNMIFRPESTATPTPLSNPVPPPPPPHDSFSN